MYSVLPLSCMATSRPNRPNILFINCHDLGQHLRCYGVGTVSTPSLDAFAAEGVRFAQSFCTAPQCSPSRSSMFTGRYPHSNGVMGLVHEPFSWDFRPGEQHLAAVLRSAGYATALAGHQHETRRPELRGWMQIHKAEEDEVPEVASAAMEALAGQEKPFYLQVGFQRPHRHDTPSGYRSPPDGRLGVTIPPYLVDEPSAREDLAGFQGDIATLDRHVGRLLSRVDALGLRDNTWVIFTTDHGIPYPRAKCSLFDPGLQTALLMRWPRGFRGGRVLEEMISNIDYVPTLLELLGLPVAANCQGRSFSGLLQETGYRPRTEIFGELTYHQYYDPRRCIRTSTHKLIVNFSASPFFMDPSQQWRPKTLTTVPRDPAQEFHRLVELYDLRSDPVELTNLSGRPELAAVESELTAKLYHWMVETDDPLLRGAVTSPMHDLAVGRLNGKYLPA